MDSKFLMGKSYCPLDRKKSTRPSTPSASSNLQLSFLKQAIAECYEFFDSFFGHGGSSCLGSGNLCDFDEIAIEVSRSIKQGEELNLFQSGGIPKRDFVSLWCLFRFLQPANYTESGVFIGSSFFACLAASPKTQALGIDPNLKKFRIPSNKLGAASLTDQYDFSESISLRKSTGISLAYFDDHINTAVRILQAHEKGYDYLIFDDSLGFDGTVSKKYPAFPTIPFILHSKELKEGDFLRWSYSPQAGKAKSIKQLIRIAANALPLVSKPHEEISVTLTRELIGLCNEANSKIEKCSKIPHLGCLVLPNNYVQFADSSKYVLKLAS